MEKAERSLLFLTAAGTVCQISDREWYGLCVLTLAMLASGDLWVHAEEEEERLPCLREKRAVSQEKYHLEAYDCSEPEEIKVYPTPLQCPEIKRLTSPSTLGTTKRQNYTILQKASTFDYPATLCIVYRSRAYYDCVWKSHVRIAAPGKVHQRETVPVEEFAFM